MKITIIRNSDGERREVDVGVFTYRYWWEEGSGACDCNRHMFFERAADPRIGYLEFPCGEDEYSIELPPEMVELRSD